ncbi:flavodoxin [Clostridium sp. M62/1]|uniref:flavodoxin n=1 Tax=Clostridium sp. M62/1 TaxID=411486 RepID=UPI003569F587
MQAATGADLFSIQASVDYPGDIDELIDYASSEQEEDVRPELTSHIENLDDYDTVFIGYPLWWYDLPQVMDSFFDEYDFSGKTLIPFDVHNGSRLSDTVETIQELEPDARVITDGFAISQSTVAEETESVAEEVSSWLQGLRN